MYRYRLENTWSPEPAPYGTLKVTLWNLSDEVLSDFRLAYTSLTRAMRPFAVEGAELELRDANYHRFAPPAGLEIAPGESWTFEVTNLNRDPRHRTDGAKSGILTLTASGTPTHVDVEVSDLFPEGRDLPEPGPLLPEGKLDEPYAVLPWPIALDLQPGDTPLALCPAPGSDAAALAAFSQVEALHRRLYPEARAVFSMLPMPGTRPVAIARGGDFGTGGYAIEVAETITVKAADDDGIRHGLIVLGQMLHGAVVDDAFRFPASGTITDAPRYSWRGSHLDVSRQFWNATDVSRFLDILAWHRMNIFHWHLTDDEGWRLEIKAYPQLTQAGATRGPDEPLTPQLGNGAKPVHGFYTQEEIRAVVAHAAALGITVVPEVDIPGHSTAALTVIDGLADPQEAPHSYHSIQGYANNALNPAREETYDFLANVFDEMVDLFPGEYLHIGGDEVADGSWLNSHYARLLMEKEGLKGTFELQSHFMRRVAKMLAERGKKLAGWNEVAHGGGVDPEGTLLMAWERPEVGIELARQGYDVVMTPGQAYYLDMVQADEWLEPGAGWAGTSTPVNSYTYEAEGDFPEELRPRMKGIQSCIWCEHFTSRAYFNRLVFPRLCGVAEAAWTPKDRKDLYRYAAIVKLHPVF
ncbi:beta-N-acetylhexosaminidase [Pseudoruegeria sp. HB172150]|uniref:beta-N-acetylhexosaminidase n=1 Tax=Pseudoruegeria sp. HB172150 TaxID=2721164 RepID=UPI00155524E4|nr:family 20 glycosylhydrolase [Pseudoruegeria sp. HB172150]